MNTKKRYKFVGNRIIKTGIAVFVTALICYLLNWPAMFAVITAIVTIEPTGSHSIKKAFTRFPAIAIGAAFAVIFTFLFGDSPYSYTLVALFTIITCQKLELQDGMLVATLTGVAMISTVHDHYVSSFLIRLGATSTGLIVSSLVNIFLLPPNYLTTIKDDLHMVFQKAGAILYKKSIDLFQHHSDSKQIMQEFQSLVKDITKTETLFSYQKTEWKFHPFDRTEVRFHYYEYKKLLLLRQVIFHIGNIVYLPKSYFMFDQNKCELTLRTVQSLKTLLCDINSLDITAHQEELRELSKWFSTQKKIMSANLKNNKHSNFLPETVILYELLSIYKLIDEIYVIQSQKMNYDCKREIDDDVKKKMIS